VIYVSLSYGTTLSTVNLLRNNFDEFHEQQGFYRKRSPILSKAFRAHTKGKVAHVQATTDGGDQR
jgi:hypothetical protein